MKGVSNEIDLRNKDELPHQLAGSLRGLNSGTLSAYESYFGYYGIEISEVERIFLGGCAPGWEIGKACDVAAAVAGRFQAVVLFRHNSTTVRAHPTTADAARYDWASQQ